MSAPVCDDLIVHELGRMVVLFQALDRDLREGVHWLLFPKDAGRGDDQVNADAVAAVTSGMSFRALVEAYFSLYFIRAQVAEERDAAKLRNALLAAEEKRNAFLHSHWFKAAGEMHRVKAARHGTARHASIVSLNEIQAINEQLATTGNEMFAFMTERVYTL